MRWLIFCLLWPCLLNAQSSVVSPDELSLEVTITAAPEKPYLGEMVLITIRGAYRRHITLEKLEQPDLDGFNWTQLGPDSWSDQRIDGKQVKILERRMALFPKRSGTLTIGSFTHHLTLTDEGDDWFEHKITSVPVSLNVSALPASAQGQWWFPVKSLKISDQWSNAPDQLKPGDGVLRVIHIEAKGATPEMIPPMPELNSPSAMVFAHPEKRLVELSPDGPVTHAFWRWTLRPTNENSAILEPIHVPYFDTTVRQLLTADIVAQRVAYSRQTVLPVEAPRQFQAALPGLWLALLGTSAFVVLSGSLLVQSRVGNRRTARPVWLRLAYWKLRAAALRKDPRAFRRALSELARVEGTALQGSLSLAELDAMIFDPNSKVKVDLHSLVRPSLDRLQNV